MAETCSRNGGHFAPSLGVVELTIALHYVMDAPHDKIVWDVGHQAYPHKLLTGRVDRFHTLRKMGGISGFPKREESPYDTFGVGHASTAFSAALGMAIARDTQAQDYRVVAVCGDGAMTGGLCYEALNNIGYLSPRMLLVLNDNEMSISPNIGAMARYFNHLITTKFYNRSKETAEDILKRLPAGERVVDFSHRVERSIKSLITEGTLFEKLGIRYIGPVDGHDLEKLISLLSQIKDFDGPVLLHAKTVKGKGYKYSESDPTRWHSNVGFEVDTGEAMGGKGDGKPKVPKYTDVFSHALVEEAERDERIVAITAAMAPGTGLDRFADRFPSRFCDFGIAEEHAVTCAAGMACDGLRPVVAIYSSFLQRAYDQVIHDVALQKLPVTFALDRAGLVGDDGPTHHGVFDLSYLRMIPGLVVMAPRDEAMLRRMVFTAARYEDGPIAYRYPRGSGEGVSLRGADEPIEIGKGEVLRYAPDCLEGPRVALLPIGRMARVAQDAADLLEVEGIGADVVDMRFVKPLDEDLLREVADRADLIVTIEDNAVAGGFGSAIAEKLFDMDIERRVVMCGIPDRWVEHGEVPDLFSQVGLDGPGVAARVRRALGVRGGATQEAVAK